MSDPLEALESYHEACAAIAGAERAHMLAQLPESLRPWAREADPVTDDQADVFALLPDLSVIRVRRLPDQGVAVAERYLWQEMVGEPLILELDDLAGG